MPVFGSSIMGDDRRGGLGAGRDDRLVGLGAPVPPVFDYMTIVNAAMACSSLTGAFIVPVELSGSVVTVSRLNNVLLNGGA